jgi:uncharacterized OB-fold protein
MEHGQRCPNCGRLLTEQEMYCYFCEMNIEELKNKGKKDSKDNKH